MFECTIILKFEFVANIEYPDRRLINFVNFVGSLPYFMYTYKMISIFGGWLGLYNINYNNFYQLLYQ